MGSSIASATVKILHKVFGVSSYPHTFRVLLRPGRDAIRVN